MSLLDKIKSMRGALRSEEDKDDFKRRFFIKKPKFSPLPPFKDVTKVNVRYPLIEPFAYVHIRWDSLEHQLVYNLIEPDLTEKERKIYTKIVDGLVELVDVELSKVKNIDAAMSYLEEQMNKVLREQGIKLEDEVYMKLAYYIYRNFLGLNEIEPLMRDPYIEDIGCDGAGVPIYIVHKKYGSIRTNITYEDEDLLRDYIVKLAERCGRYISYAEPLLDGTLPDGSRVNASLAKDVTTHGPTFSIRKFSERPFTPVDMIESKTISLDALAFMWLAAETGSNIMVTGGTATGKTSMLNTITMFIPPEDKIVSIEDTRELRLPHQNWIPSVSRIGFGVPGASGEKYGEVTLYDLLKGSFRQNPDYVIVGEVRGKEAYVMFQGMSSGHPSMSTMHAGDVDSLLRRLITPPIELSPSLLESLDLVVTMAHAKERGASARRVKSITEILSVSESGRDVEKNKIYKWNTRSDDIEKTGDPAMFEKMADKKGLEREELLAEYEKRKQILKWLVDQNLRDFDEVAEIITTYYKNPSKIESLMGGSAGEFPFHVVGEKKKPKKKSEPKTKPKKTKKKKEDVKGKLNKKKKLSKKEKKKLMKQAYPFKVISEEDIE